MKQLAREVEGWTENEWDWLHLWVMTSTIGTSTRIEDVVLTDAEIEWVDTTLLEDGHPSAFEAKKTAIHNKLSKDRERSVEEVVGCFALLSLVCIQSGETFPLTEAIICGLHKELLRHYPGGSRYARRYKNSPNNKPWNEGATHRASPNLCSPPNR